MSKDRELLKRVRDTLRELKETHYDLYWDIQSALDQPEQVGVSINSDLLEALIAVEARGGNIAFTVLVEWLKSKGMVSKTIPKLVKEKMNES